MAVAIGVTLLLIYVCRRVLASKGTYAAVPQPMPPIFSPVVGYRERLQSATTESNPSDRLTADTPGEIKGPPPEYAKEGEDKPYRSLQQSLGLSPPSWRRDVPDRSKTDEVDLKDLQTLVKSLAKD